ncbi:ATP-dependent helicase HrpB [Stagnimonas aquatica]|uniref:ATP-dependent helicase HrpB n=1 Tax=Stagnimonas aquatica TaxID=2689987 RepID=A0A3N0VJQ4_9GAMM|nr:ATP-dependent helicase HrpB [Stagnimonas aquatica]ROH92976.1 ATP-dependent helicase HrpB [Stagnimonas aquatica]
MKLPDYPALEALPALRAALRAAGRAVLAAPPGSGKTTTIPLALLDEPWLAGKKIVLLEPRRVAARAAAARMAALLGEKVGGRVGYQIRFERRIGPETRIEVVTEGLLTRRLQADPELPGVGLVIFDEFHERSLDADLALALALDARDNLNPELRLLVMSATLDTERVAQLLADPLLPLSSAGEAGGVPATMAATPPSQPPPAGGGRGIVPAPIITAGGSLYPVDIRYRPARPEAAHDEAVAALVSNALAETEGDILCFLPGAREIRGVERRVSERYRELAIRPLYGELSSDLQDLALRPNAEGRRKLILATNIAQTSLTVEGVTTVVDGGLVRAARFDLGAGANVLETRRVSRASADQRAGRAGRLGPGTAYRLWSQEQHGRLVAHDTPEVLAADLSRFALELAGWGIADPAALRLLDAPTAANWSYARELLLAMGAIDAQGRITAHGRQLARLPTAPRLAHLLLQGQARGQGELAAWLAAALEEREADGGSDAGERVARLRAGRGDPGQLRRVQDSVRQFLRLLESPSPASGVGAGSGRSTPERSPQAAAGEEAVAVLLSHAFPERLARRREGSRDSGRQQREVAFLCADGGEARLPETDPLARADWLAIAHWSVEGNQRRIRLAAPLDEAQLRAEHGGRLRREALVRWDAGLGAVQAEQQERLGALVLSARPLREPDAAAREQIRAALIAGIRATGLHALPWSEGARGWQARVESLRHWQPEAGWPEVSDPALLASLEDWLSPYLDGMSRLSHLDKLDLMGALQAQLDYPQQQALSRLAPTHLTVPSGNRHALSYTPGQAPALEVKLQEMFGASDTPTVCDGRVKVVLHMLSPGRKPIAITADLAGFWARSYFEVKKDLRGRYPRHPWPDDPLAAQATARAKPRGT